MACTFLIMMGAIIWLNVYFIFPHITNDLFIICLCICTITVVWSYIIASQKDPQKLSLEGDTNVE